MMQNLAIWIVIGCVFFGCKKDHEEPLPDYMLERFEPSGTLDTVSYMRLQFPDSTLFIADTMDNVIRFDGWGHNKVAAGLRLNDSIFFRIEFYDDLYIEDQFEFVQIGSYVLCDPYNCEKGARFRIIISSIGRSMQPESSYFHVYNREGNSFWMTVYGAFDLVLARNPESEKVRIQGEFNLVFHDPFF